MEEKTKKKEVTVEEEVYGISIEHFPDRIPSRGEETVNRHGMPLRGCDRFSSY